MKYYATTIVLLLAGTSVFAAVSPTPISGNTRLVGKWTWTRSANNCTEVYEYRADGTMYVTSGAEKSDNSYSLAAEQSINGFFKLTTAILKDYGGRDCADSETDDTGAADTNFIQFNPTGNQYILCREETFEHCIGPLRRVDK